MDDNVTSLIMKHLERIEDSIEADRKERREDREVSQAKREQIAHDVTMLRHQHNELHNHVASLTDRVDKIEPVSDMVQSWRARMLGALALLGVIGTLIMTLLGFFKAEAVSIINRLFGG